MIVLQLQNVAKSFGAQDLFKNLSLSINEGERLALIGSNGCGKTTLLRCITGQVKPDAGEIIKKADINIGYLEQISEGLPDMLLWDAVMSSFTNILQIRQTLVDIENKMASHKDEKLDRLMEDYVKATAIYEQADGYQCESLAKKILLGMGFQETVFHKPISAFSGGEKTRINLARLLAQNPQILLLDEPTNHLDMPSVEWLESYLKNYNGTVVVVSHDRMFLDNIATRVAEVRGGKILSFTGNYNTYIEKRKAADIASMRAFEKQQEKIEAAQAFIRRYQAGIKAKQARGRQSQLDHLEKLTAPEQKLNWKNKSIDLKRDSGQDVVYIESVSKYYADRPILNKIDLHIRKGEKLALIGANGSGKTTLLKIIIGELSADEGNIRRGSQVDIGYFSQEHENLNLEGMVLDEIIDNFDLTLGEARLYLGSMLFTGDDVFKKIKDLSGGEQGRLVLLKLILSGVNFLILDEPTNHLDIDSRQATAEMLQNYPGTILFVSHDRYFIDSVANQTLVLAEGKLKRYWGNYSYYAEKLAEESLVESKKKIKQNQITPEQEFRLKQKERAKKRRQLVRAIETLEENITAGEEEQQHMEKLLSEQETYRYEESSKDLPQRYQMVLLRLEELIREWEKLNQELFHLENEKKK